MSPAEIFILALALSIDACIVSFTYGLCFDKERLKNSVLLAGFTGGFQALMPVIAYFLTSFVKEFISPWASAIVFTIFVFLGIKFIKESFEKKAAPSCISPACLFLIGVGTSIDAFSAGISLSLYGNLILKPALLIGLVTAVNSLLGFALGGKLKFFPSRGLEIFAGLILIFLGVKALL